MLQLANLGPAVKRKKTGNKGGAVVRTLAITAVTLCGLNKIVVFFPFVLSGVSPATSVFPSKQNPVFSNSNNSTRNITKMWICILVYLSICLFIHLDATICHIFHPPYFFFFVIYF